MRFVERDIEIFKAVVGGKTLRQVAEAHGVSAGRIQQIVDRMRRCATGSFNRNEPRSHDVGPPDFHEDPNFWLVWIDRWLPEYEASEVRRRAEALRRHRGVPKRLASD